LFPIDGLNGKTGIALTGSINYEALH
jgi:hypothetical protein